MSKIALKNSVYLWFQIARSWFPNHDLIGKADDDVYLCQNILIQKLTQDNHPYLYWGWQWFFEDSFGHEKYRGQFPSIKYDCGENNCIKDCPKDKRNITTHAHKHCYYGQVNEHVRMDEFLVVLGSKLVDKILEKEYCIEDKIEICQKQGKLFDTNFAGQSLGLWLNQLQQENVKLENKTNLIDDPLIKIKRYQRKIVHYGHRKYYLDVLLDIIRREKLGSKFRFNFCDNFIAFHKTNLTYR